jgi:hypothetical protein
MWHVYGNDQNDEHIVKENDKDLYHKYRIKRIEQRKAIAFSLHYGWSG